MERVTSANVQDHIRAIVKKDAHLMADELNVYHALHMGYKHATEGKRLTFKQPSGASAA